MLRSLEKFANLLKDNLTFFPDAEGFEVDIPSGQHITIYHPQLEAFSPEDLVWLGIMVGHAAKEANVGVSGISIKDNTVTINLI